MTSPIPSFYRTWFTILDPILSVTGVVANLFFPNAYLDSLTTSATNPPTIETTALLDSLAGFYGALVFLQLGLLRPRPRDLGIWRTLQAATLVVDVFILEAFARALHAQGRLGLVHWRAEEWMNIGLTAFVAVLRTAFLLGLGMEPQGKTAGRAS